MPELAIESLTADGAAEPSDGPLVMHVRCVTGTGGGPEKTILNSPRHLRRWGYRAQCAYLHPPGDPGIDVLQRRAAEAAAPLIAIPDRGPLDLRVVKEVVRLCRRERVAIWHGHDYKTNVLGLVARRCWPMRVVSTVHGWVEHTRRTPLYYAIDKLCLPYLDQVVAVSQDLYEECLKIGVRESRCRLVHNGIDVDDFRRTLSREAARRRVPHPISGALAGAMGRLSEEKGFDLLIRAVARLRQEGILATLWIAGEGGARTSLESLIAELQLQDRVRLLGYVGDSKTFFQALDAFVLSSRREGLPNVLLEAMALETPAVATRIAGVPSLVKDGENGLLVEPESVEGLAGGLRRLLSDERLGRSLAAAARQTIEAEFSFERRIQRKVEIYDRVLSQSRWKGADR